MTREEAIKTIRLTCPKINDSECDFETAMRFLIPELAESEEEKIRREIVDFICWAIDRGSITEEQRERSDTWLAYLEKQKEQPTNEEMLRTLRAEYEKGVADTIAKYEQKEQKEIPLMNGDADLYFDNWIQHNDTTKRGYFEEGIRYAQRLQKEQKPADLSEMMVHKEPYIVPVPTPMVADEQKPAEWKPQPESLEALMYAIEGKWEAIKPTSYLSRRLEDLYEGLVNTYNVDETHL